MVGTKPTVIETGETLMDGDRFDPKAAAKSLWGSVEPQGERVGKYRPLTTSSGNKQYDSYYDQYGKQFDVDPNLLIAQGNQESSFKRNARSNKGAMGLGQIMPATARRLGVSNPYDPAQSIMGQAKYMSQHLAEFKDIDKALAAYNAGEGAVRKYRGIPPYKETKDYVKKIRGHYNSLIVPQFDAKTLAKSLWDNADRFDPQAAAKSLWGSEGAAIAPQTDEQPVSVNVPSVPIPSQPSLVDVSETPDFTDAPNDPRAIKPPFTLPADPNIQSPPVDRTYPPQGANIPDDVRQNYNEYLQLTGQADTPQVFQQYQKETQGAYEASVKQFGQPPQQQPPIDDRPRLAPGIVTRSQPKVIKGKQIAIQGQRQPQSRAQVTFTPTSEASNIRNRNLFAVTETMPSDRVYKSAPTKEQFLKDAITDYYGSKAFEAETAYRRMTGKELFPSARDLPDIAPHWNAKTGKVEGDLYQGGNVRELVRAYDEGGEDGLRAELGMQNQRSSAQMDVTESQARQRLRNEILQDELSKFDPTSASAPLKRLLESPFETLYDAYQALSGKDILPEIKNRIDDNLSQRMRATLNEYGSAQKAIAQREQEASMPLAGKIVKQGAQLGKGAIVDNLAPAMQFGGILQSAFERNVLGKDTEAKDTDLYKSGEALKQAGESFFGKTEGFTGELSRTTGQVLGTLLTTALGAGAINLFSKAGGLSANAVTALGSAQGVMQVGSQAYETAKNRGATEDQALLATLLSAPAGALEGLSERFLLGKLAKLQKLDNVTAGAFSKTLRQKLEQVGKDALKGGAIEGLLEEFPQNFWTEQSVKLAYKKDPVTFKGVLKDLDSALEQSWTAFIVGGGVSGGVSAIEQQAESSATQSEQSQIEKASFYHQDFGQVIEDENQAGVPQGKIRVTDIDGNPHVIQKPNKAGKGNQKAVIAETKATEVLPEAAPTESDRPISPEELEKKIAEVEAKIPDEAITTESVQQHKGSILPADEGVRLDTAAKIDPKDIAIEKPAYQRQTTLRRTKEEIANDFETTPTEMSAKRGKEFDAEVAKLLGQSKELVKAVPIDDTVLLSAPYAVTYKSASGKTMTRRMTVGKRQDALLKKEGVLEKLLGCVHG